MSDKIVQWFDEHSWKEEQQGRNGSHLSLKAALHGPSILPILPSKIDDKAHVEGPDAETCWQIDLLGERVGSRVCLLTIRRGLGLELGYRPSRYDQLSTTRVATRETDRLSLKSTQPQNAGRDHCRTGLPSFDENAWTRLLSRT